MPIRKLAYIDLYVSSGEAEQGVLVRGRALEGERPALGQLGDRRRNRLRATWRLFETDELPSVDVELRLDLPGETRIALVQTNDEGFFAARFKPALPVGRFEVSARLTEPVVETEWVSAPVIIHPSAEGLGVISDVDDTVLDTGVTRKLELIQKILLSTPEHLATFPGTAELFQRFEGMGLPLVFVSGSPVNLEPRLREFMRLRGFPSAPMLLKDLGVAKDADALLDHEGYKLRRIREVFEQFPKRRFLLLGDSGEHDPEIYARVRKENPERVAGVFIHRVTQELPDAERFEGATLFESWNALGELLRAAGHLVDR